MLLTLLINATTIIRLLSVLGMSEISDSKKAAMSNAVRRYKLNFNNKAVVLWVFVDEILEYIFRRTDARSVLTPH